MSPIEHAVISAAGIGSRLGLNKPKCLVEVGGKTLLAQHLERLAEIPNVWVVVGFQEELVIEQVRNLRRDAIIVRNPDFDRTNTLQSIHRVSRYLDRRFLAVDGDTFIENRSFERFLRAAAGQAGLIGVSRYTTSDGVRVLLDAGGEAVTAFTREPQHAYEWTGIAILGRTWWWTGRYTCTRRSNRTCRCPRRNSTPSTSIPPATWIWRGACT